MITVIGIGIDKNGKRMKIIKTNTSWDNHSDILVIDDIHPLYTQKIVTLLNAARRTHRNSYNTKFVAVEDNYKLHIKQICF
jgi:hypothetical protein